jgi:hypothetical protein
LPAELPTGYLLLLILTVLLLAWLFARVWRRRRSSRSLSRLFSRIAFERIDNLIVPNVDEGEIQIDHLLLTAYGFLIVDVKDVAGAVFGSDNMQDWTVLNSERRFTFANPQPPLLDRIAALRNIVRQVPVAGRILFTDDAEFTKGVPSLVCKADDLLDEFAAGGKEADKAKIETFKPSWELLRGQVSSSQTGRFVRYRRL